VATGANDIQSDGEFQIARIEIYQMIRPLGRDVVQQFLGQIAVRVYDPNAVPERDVLQDQVSQQGGFSRAGLADDVEVLPFVHGGNAKGLGIAPAGLLTDDDVRGLVVHGAKTSRHPFHVPVVVDVMTPAAVLGARRRDNGGWFWNPNGTPVYHASPKTDALLARLNHQSAQSGDAFSQQVAKRSVLTGLVVTLVEPVVLSPRFGVNRSRRRNRGWVITLILKPVPQRVGG
jgi:hypothetical protein